jgi:hypothetical protein
MALRRLLNCIGLSSKVLIVILSYFKVISTLHCLVTQMKGLDGKEMPHRYPVRLLVLSLSNLPGTAELSNRR